MRRFLIIVLALAGACNVWAQKHQPEKILSINAPVNIASTETRKSFTPPAEQNLKSGSVLESDFQVEFQDFPEDAKSAFLYATSIYESLLSSSVPITVQAKWESLSTNVLAKSTPSSFYKNFDNARLADVYYPVALAEKISGEEINGTEVDIVCTLNSSINWYFGTNGNCPTDQYDFVTIVLHELVHGLGFSGFFTVDGENGTLDNSGNIPSVYDVYVYNSTTQIADKNQVGIPSSQLKGLLQSGNLCLKGNDGVEKETIYAPASWNVGTSVYHYHESGYESGDANALMSPFVFKGEAIHYPGDKTLEVLAELGWESISIDGLEISDFEDPCASLPVWVEIGGEMDVDSRTVQITYSTDRFETAQTISLEFNNSSKKFEGNIPLNNASGKIMYYYSATTKSNIAFSCPSLAPEQVYSFTIGPDYYPPELSHNPIKILSTAYPSLELSAVATDNVGINSVEVEVLINGLEQESVQLEKLGEDTYSGVVQLSEYLADNDVVEYRVVAVDNTARQNQKYSPSSGYYSVEVFEPEQVLTGYNTDFESDNSDFEISEFNMSTPSGFSSGILHTVNPYPTSNVENEKYDLIAQLKYPILIEENGEMSFDEVVLVEPGDDGTIYTEQNFWDFVIVEGSKNNGKSWLPVTQGYDSGVDGLWYSNFTSSLKSTVSEADGNENMFLRQTINLTEDTSFEAGDTVIFRFRLASDEDVTGWGWAIDNLNIQEMTTAADDILAQEDVSIYPNPFSGSIYVEGFDSDGNDVEIIVTDLYGKTVYRETRYDPGYGQKFKIDLPNVASGVYMACITDNLSKSINQKIIKN